MSKKRQTTLEIACPCCGARLTIDKELGGVLHHIPPAKDTHAPDLSQAATLLESERARRELLFQQSSQETRIKSQLLERKFEEALKNTKDEPVKPPLRDIDLD